MSYSDNSDIESGLSHSSNEGDSERRPLLRMQGMRHIRDLEQQQSDEETFIEANGSQLVNVLQNIINGDLSEDDEHPSDVPTYNAETRSREQELRRAISSMHLSYSCSGCVMSL